MPKFVQWLYPERIWAFMHKKNAIYLTFDDGPIPEVTPWVLDELKNHNAKATFFCIGDNVQKHPKVFKRIISEGHSVGNHTYNHLNGRKTQTSAYIENVQKAAKQMIDGVFKVTHDERPMTEDGLQNKNNSEIGDHPSTTTKNQLSINDQQSLFRPPYGKITSKQAKTLRKKGFKIVMWDIISYDYDRSISKEKCLQNVLKNLKPGSIIVFHDSLKAEKNLRYVLPKVLEFISEKGFHCKRI